MAQMLNFLKQEKLFLQNKLLTKILNICNHFRFWCFKSIRNMTQEWNR